MNEINEFQASLNNLPTEVPEINDKNTYTTAELWGTKDVQDEFLIPELLPKYAVAVLIGEDGIGKTQILIQLCLHIAMQMNTFLSLTLLPKHKRSLFVATEDSKEKFIKSLSRQALSMDPNINPENVHVDFMEGANFDNLDELLNEIKKELSMRSYELLVIDAMSDLFTLMDGDINSNSHARVILNKLQAVCKKFNTTIIVVHHVPKSKLSEKKKNNQLFLEKGDGQGASSITQKPRTVLALTHDPKSVTNNGQFFTNFLHMVKTNNTGKYYMANAIQLGFDGSCLVHGFKGMTDIKAYESNDGGMKDPNNKSHATTSSSNIAPNLAPPPTGIAYAVHVENMKKVFAKMATLPRTLLVARMKSVYSCGATKIEAANVGILAQVKAQGIIIQTESKEYKMNDYQAGINFQASDQPLLTPDAGDDVMPF